MVNRNEAARRIFQYLCIRDEMFAKADLVIGFGHFDHRIPKLCGALYEGGYAAHLLLTGGRGAGTADLPDAEANVFREVLCEAYPTIPSVNVFVENESTNTGENIRFSNKTLKKADAAFCFERGIQSVIAVASPYRQRRVRGTMRKMYPAIDVCNRPPETSFEEEERIFNAKNQDFTSMVFGEMDRIIDYPAKGYMAAEVIPPEVVDAYKRGGSS